MLRPKKHYLKLTSIITKMNEQINWDQTLIKKYSSSNHFKLLNQLRNEIKKYPLNRNRILSSNINNDNENIINQKVSEKKDQSPHKYSNTNKEINNNKSTVSFNNSKNFSIYNNMNNLTKKEVNEENLIDEKVIDEQSSNSTFKDRLNQIDMK